MQEKKQQQKKETRENRVFRFVIVVLGVKVPNACCQRVVTTNETEKKRRLHYEHQSSRRIYERVYFDF